jgi:hypothetical protein
MDGVSWMKRNEWTINPWFFRTIHHAHNITMPHPPSTRTGDYKPMDDWQSYSTRRTSILVDDKNEIDGWYINLLWL